LIIQTAFLGDVILTLPLVQTLKKFVPESNIDFLCIPSTAAVLLNNPYINKIIEYDKLKKKFSDLYKMMKLVSDSKYDVIICPHRSLRSALITEYSDAEVRIGFDRNVLSGCLTNQIEYYPHKHEIIRNLGLLKEFPGMNYNENDAILKPELFPSENDETVIIEKLKDVPLNRLISIAPCSQWFTKQLPENKTIDITKHLTINGFYIVLLGGPKDTDYGKTIEKNFSKREVLNLCGETTALQSYIVIKKSKVLITVDSATNHLCAATDTPVVFIYGSTDSSFGFYPLTSKNIIIENKSLECRPCTDHGRKDCPLKHFKCMEELDAEDIVVKTEELIKESN
jgi:heptosyltransferase II